MKRRVILAATAIVCLATAHAAEPPPGRDGEDWPAFLGPRGSGVSGETGLLHEWPAGGPPVLWRKKVGEGYAAPAVLGDRLVFFHRIGDEEVVECFAAATGAALWRFAYPTSFTDPYGYNGGPRSSPVLAGNRCFTFGAAGILSCIDLATGGLIWQRDTNKEFAVPQAFFGVGSTPLVDGDRLLVIIGGHPRSGVVAFDTATGKTLWQAVGPDDFPEPPIRIQRDRPPVKLAAYSSPAIATIHGQRHLLCLMRPGLVSLDPENGAIRFTAWFRSHLHDSVNAAQPVVVGSKVFLTAAYDTGAMMLDVAPAGRRAEVAWKDEDAMQSHWSTAIPHDGFLYGFSGRHEANTDLRCIRVSDGSLVWQAFGPEGGAGSYGRGSAILADGRLIVMSERGAVALVERSHERFREVSRFTLPEFEYPCWTAPVLSRKRLFLTGCRSRPGPGGMSASEYHLVCLDLTAR